MDESDRVIGLCLNSAPTPACIASHPRQANRDLTPAKSVQLGLTPADLKVFFDHDNYPNDHDNPLQHKSQAQLRPSSRQLSSQPLLRSWFVSTAPQSGHQSPPNQPRPSSRQNFESQLPLEILYNSLRLFTRLYHSTNSLRARPAPRLKQPLLPISLDLPAPYLAWIDRQNFLNMRRPSITASPNRPLPLPISSATAQPAEDQLCYSANENDLRRRSSHLARLALRAESVSIRSYLDDGEIEEEENEEAEVEVEAGEPGLQESERDGEALFAQSSLQQPYSKSIELPTKTTLHERSPLCFGQQHNPSPLTNPNYRTLPAPIGEQQRKPFRSIWKLAQELLECLPAVALGLMMNILDGVSYGLIMFPTGAGVTIFDGFGGIGISMFFVTCIVSQLVFSLGGSGFRGGNGSMMIESVPFMHVIAKKIISGIGTDQPERIIATTMVSFAMSSILTGIAFFALGALKLGDLMGFFPRHILVGCIGSVGAFLLLTGIEVTGHLDAGFSLHSDVLQHLLKTKILPLWLVPLGLAIILRIVTRFYSQPYVVPTYFLAIPFIFYAITNCAGFSLHTLRSTGWVFDIDLSDHQGPFAFYSLFKFDAVDWRVLKTTITAQLAMVIFGLLHVPLNVPALAISMGKDNVNINKELIAHGISNTLAGLTGTVSNYLCYVNSVLFTRVGGDSRLAGLMLAIATMGVFGLGPGVIAYLPVCVVGALIYVLGIDLMKEAVWDTCGKVSWVEYVTIWAIIIAATWHDFVVGLVVGVVLACMSFVVTSSQHKAIRSIMDGRTARSTVRRHPTQHAFLKEAGSQTRVLKLQGHLFFGTISACEQTIKHLLQSSDKQPIRFLIVDFTSTASIDFSAVEAFLRIHRLLLAKSVVFVICGTADQVREALRSVGLWSGEGREGIEAFEFLNEALEHCENVYLKNLYYAQETDVQLAAPSSQDQSQFYPSPSHQVVPFDGTHCESSGVGSSLRKNPPGSAAVNGSVLEYTCQLEEGTAIVGRNFTQPLPLLIQTFRPFLPELNEDFWFKVAPHFVRVEFAQDELVWQIGSKADCFYLIQRGILKASYAWPKLVTIESDLTIGNTTREQRSEVEESMLPGTVAGDHTFLAEVRRNTRVVAETDVALWRMDKEAWGGLDVHVREVVARGMLKMAAEEEEVLIGHLFTRF